MSHALLFEAMPPESAAVRLDSGSIHLWRIPRVPPQGREPLLALLGAYLGVPGSSVSLTMDPRGKPRLADTPGNGQLEFNWSHSGDYALVALARGCPLGVDIERLGNNPRALDIARRFFDQDEAATLAQLDPGTRDDAFIALWCAKEAVLKESGEGLSFGLARLAFARGPGGDWALVRADPTLGNAAHWQLRTFDPVSGYHGALAWRGVQRDVAAFRPPDSRK